MQGTACDLAHDLGSDLALKYPKPLDPPAANRLHLAGNLGGALAQSAGCEGLSPARTKDPGGLHLGNSRRDYGLAAAESLAGQRFAIAQPSLNEN